MLKEIAGVIGVPLGDLPVFAQRAIMDLQRQEQEEKFKAKGRMARIEYREQIRDSRVHHVVEPSKVLPDSEVKRIIRNMDDDGLVR